MVSPGAPPRTGPAAVVRPPRRRTGWTVALPLLAAALLGPLAAVAPLPTLAGVGVLVALAAVVLRLEWIAVAFVVASVFEDYLVRVAPGAVKALGVVLVASWAVRRARGRVHEGPRGRVLPAALVFAAVLLLATAVHNNGNAGLVVVLRYAGFLGTLVVLADVARGRVGSAGLARAYVVACAVAACCGLLTFLLGADRRAGGPIADPNDFAFFLLAAVPLAVALRRTTTRRWPWDLAAVVLLVAVVGTLSRGALVGVGAMILLVVVTGMVRLRSVLVLGAAAAVAVGAVAVALPDLVSVSLEQKDVVAGQNVSERLDLWTAAARMTADDPLLGRGPGSFAQDHRDFLTTLPDDVNHPLDVAHNTWLELSSEVGVLGLLAFVAMLAAAFGQAWSAWRRGDPLGAGVCAGLVGTVLAASFVTEQYYLPLWLLTALAVGLRGREPA